MARILIVDDSAYQRLNIRKLLKPDGHELLEAADGREALEVVAKHTLDCILTDLIMPEVDGWEFLEALRDQGSSVPVIVITADIQETTHQRCKELGVATVINKPLKQDRLSKTVRNILDSHEDVAP